ncbi:NACHT domain-containing protein [Microcoleus sp. FACHB-831]|uniref:NACHT domain-containing protein n=1 Tax=Microcoleus sp. FACHB-831 TaxID=2692827 RepID=UPI0016836BF3|nr:NACHT domain-containing protein [Microcoleus sp. FACHB-831]MBD1922316.1 NACHT domain-containing protein [Microcoleus sp. FACHB-831]
MNQQHFKAIFNRLTKRREEVLLRFLANETDEAIAQSLHITPATVRKHLEKICKEFGLTNDFADERRSKRQDLLVLFANYKPELLGGCSSIVTDKRHVEEIGSAEETRLETTNLVEREEAIADSPENDIDELVRRVRSHPYRHDKIQEQCGRLRILDVDSRVGIDDIYIHVNVLEKLPSTRQLDISDFQSFNPATDNFDRLGLGKVREPQVPGLEAVTRYSKLMVLGKPGAGKTTFLKFLAIQCNQGEFQGDRIPIFIELKAFARKRIGDFRLLNYISQELTICDISHQQVENLLYEGRFFILLDGLDEVKADVGDEVLTEVCTFSSKYFKNQFVITCRIAAQLANQRDSLNFDNVEVADFNYEQIEAFAKKWFVEVGRNSNEQGEAKANQFVENLHLPENEQIRELAVTPILLNLACLFFQEKSEFPSNRAKLYEQGLDILLERWDESRGIQRDEAYRNLSLEDKKQMLIQVAFIMFERGDYFFEQDTIHKIIADYLRTLPDAQTEPKALKRNSKAVLKSVEAQHGLLVERSREIYSFSHLTFQEYFTAKNFVDSYNWQNLVKYIAEPRWSEVFLLAAGMLKPADELLRLMKQEVDAIVRVDEQLQKFLVWVKQKSLSVEVRFKPAAVRAFYFAFALDRRNVMPTILSTTLAHALNSDLTNEFCNDFKNKCATGLALDCALLLDLNLARDHALGGTFASQYALDPELKRWLQKLQQTLKDQLPELIKDTQGYRAWWEANGPAWTEELRYVMREYRNIGRDWGFSEAQMERLEQYYDANKLLVDCLNSASNVSPEVRQEIEDTLLLPIAEIDNLKNNALNP